MSATMIGVMAVASSEPRSQNIGHDDGGGDRGEARDQEGLERDAAALVFLLAGSPLRR